MFFLNRCGFFFPLISHFWGFVSRIFTDFYLLISAHLFTSLLCDFCFSFLLISFIYTHCFILPFILSSSKLLVLLILFSLFHTLHLSIYFLPSLPCLLLKFRFFPSFTYTPFTLAHLLFSFFFSKLYLLALPIATYLSIQASAHLASITVFPLLNACPVLKRPPYAFPGTHHLANCPLFYALPSFLSF